MKGKKFVTLASVCAALLCSATFALSGCGGATLKDNATQLAYSTGINAEGNYDESMFFRNDLFTAGSADPGAVYCEEDGYFYIFVTGLSCKRTKDFVQFEDMGLAFAADSDAWSYANYWAPEVIYDKESKLYYMYYSASAKGINEISQWDSLRIGIAVSEKPQGPYRDWEGTRLMPKRDANGRRVQENGEDVFVEETITKSQFPLDFTQSPYAHDNGCSDVFATIDVSPFIDDNGDVYLYFVRHTDRHNPTNSVWGVKMFDLVTPDYDTLKQLTEPGKKTVGGENNFEINNGINEGPFMLSHVTEKPNGEKVKKYYLTYSNYGYTNRGYSVACALSDDPLGDFVKLDATDCQPILGIDADFDHMAGTAHHQFLKYGDEYFVMYHAHANRQDINKARALAFDRIAFAYDEKYGCDLIYANGPTYSLQPLPYALTGYKNLALEATVTADSVASGSSVSYLNDGRVAIGENKDYDFLSAGNSVTVTLTFDREVSVRAIMVYNGRELVHAFSKVDLIRFDGEDGAYYIEDLIFPDAYISGKPRMRPGGAAVAEFNEIKTNKITICITQKVATELLPDADDVAGISISDIVVIGK